MRILKSNGGFVNCPKHGRVIAKGNCCSLMDINCEYFDSLRSPSFDRDDRGFLIFCKHKDLPLNFTLLKEKIHDILELIEKIEAQSRK